MKPHPPPLTKESPEDAKLRVLMQRLKRAHKVVWLLRDEQLMANVHARLLLAESFVQDALVRR